MSETPKQRRPFLNPLNERDRACLCKRRFATKEECDENIQAGGKPFGIIELKAYKCKFCDGWHKTKHKVAHYEAL